jgi:hypothetical protein
MSDLRFLVQGSEVFGPRMAQRTRMGSREDAKTRRREGGLCDVGEGRGVGNVRGSARSMGRGNGRRSCRVRQTNFPSRLGGLVAFPFLVPSRSGRGSKAAKPQRREGDGGNDRETVRDRLLRLIVAVKNPEVHKSGDEPCRVQ